MDILSGTQFVKPESWELRQLLLPGGALLRSDLPELIKFTHQQGIVPVLLTNGSLLPQRWQEMGESGLRYVIISIDSLKQDVYRVQRGLPLQVGLDALSAAKDMRAAFSGTHIHVTAVLTKANLQDLPQMARTLSNQDVWLQITPYHHFLDQKPDTFSPDTNYPVEQVICELCTLKEQGVKIANSKAFLEHIPAFFRGKRVPDNYQCLAGCLALFVDAYMNVLPCWSQDFPPVGNIVRQKLKDIWQGDAFEKARTQMRACHCKGCWLLCAGELTLLVQEKGD